MYKIMKEVKKHIQSEYICNAFILQKREDMRSIVDILKLGDIHVKQFRILWGFSNE
jgi:hypothetical protein